MAGVGILADGVTEILKGLSTLVAKEIGLAWGVKDELQKLNKTLEMILTPNVIDDAEKKKLKNEGVRLWLEELKAIAYEAEDILDEYAYEIIRQREHKRDGVSNFFSISNSRVLDQKISHELKNISKTFIKHVFKESLGLQMQKLDPSSSSMDLDESSKLLELRETDSIVDPSLKIIGREKDKSNIIKMLLDNDSNNQDGNIQVIPIVGMGGLGKTTLAQLIFNDNTVKEHFELKMWVHVSDEFNEKKLFVKIIESITKDKCEDVSNIDDIAHELEQYFNGKKYLLVLDDVWNKKPEDWLRLKKPLGMGGSGSKILITTRSEEVASIMGNRLQSYELGILDQDESWSLFHERMFGYLGGIAETPFMTRTGKRLVDKCKGLPLALISLISSLRNKNEKEWRNLRMEESWVKSRTLPILKLSYDNLPFHLKQCFSYFSLFGENYIFNPKIMILLWMAEGFLPQPSGGNITSMEEVGNEYFNSLLHNSFFQDVKKNEFGQVESFKMHHLVYYLAKYVADDTESSSYNFFHNTPNMKSIRRLQLIADDTRMPVFDNNPKLRTLLISISMDYRLENNAFDGTRRLRVLVLEKATEITEIPSSSCSCLKHLRYLDLSNTKITNLPKSIMSLYNLQTLNIRHCKNLKVLPKGIGKLFNLRHLFLPEDISLPMEIGQLTGLQTLTSVNAYNKYGEKAGSGIDVLERLNLLDGEIRVSNLRNVINEIDVQRANLKGKKNLNKIVLNWVTDSVLVTASEGEYNKDEAVLEALQPHPNLKELSIYAYYGVKLPQWMGDPSCLPNLVGLQLSHCTKCEQVVGFGKLPSLKDLRLLNMDGIKCLGNEFYYGNSDCDGEEVGEVVVLFPSLKKLFLYDLSYLEEWVDYIPSPTVSNYSCFPCLENITIQSCPNLRITPTRFSSLKELTLENMNERVVLSLITTNLKSLEIVNLFQIKELRFLPHRLLQGTSNLKELKIFGCNDFQGFDQNEEEEKEERFTSLKVLRLHYLRNLEFLPDIRSFTSLENLFIEDCRRFKPLPEDLKCLSSSLKHLKKVHIKKVKEVEYFECGSKESYSADDDWRALQEFEDFKWTEVEDFKWKK